MVHQMNYPQGNLYISVSTEQSHVYHSGDVIRGVVRVHPRTRPLRVNIAFRGRMKCSITISSGSSAATYGKKPEFFLHTLELFSSATRSYDITGLGITQDDRVEIPFEFQFPERTELNPGSKWAEHRSARFDSEAGGLLPPTYKKLTGGNDILVEYFLEAKLFQTSKFTHDCKVRHPVTFRPAPPRGILDSLPLVHTNRPSVTQNHRGIWIRTHRLHPDYDPNEGLQDRIKHRLTKSRTTTPFVSFKIDVSYPEVLVSDDPMLLTLSLEYMERSKDIPDSPPIYLRRVRVRLLSITHVRIPRPSSIVSNNELYDKHNGKKDLLDIHFSQGDGQLLFDGLRLRSEYIPMGIAPTFQTYGIALDYAIEIHVWGECAKERFEKTLVPRGKVLIVSRPRSPGVGEEIGVEQPPAAEEDAAPPPYQVLGKNV